MSVTNGKVTAPVSIADIRQVLGVNSGDLGTLCRSDKINMWAKYKPVPLRANTHLSQWDSTNNRWKTQTELGGTVAWWKGQSGDCGLRAVSDTPLGLVSGYDGNMNGWEKDEWDSYSWNRIEDFVGYNHNALGPYRSFRLSDENIDYGDAFSAHIMLASPDELGDSIQLGDMNAIKDCYFGIFIQDSEDSTWIKRITATSTLSNGAANVALTEADSRQLPRGKSYYVYAMCSTVRYDEILSTEQVGTYYLLPFVTRKTLVISNTTGGAENRIKVVVRCRYAEDELGNLDYTTVNVTIDASESTDTYNNCGLYIMRSGRNWNQTRYNDEGYINIGTVAAGQTYTYSWEHLDQNQRVYVATVTLNGGQYTKKAAILRPIEDE